MKFLTWIIRHKDNYQFGARSLELEIILNSISRSALRVPFLVPSWQINIFTFFNLEFAFCIEPFRH